MKKAASNRQNFVKQHTNNGILHVPEDSTLQNGEFAFLSVKDERDADDAPEHEEDDQNGT